MPQIEQILWSESRLLEGDTEWGCGGAGGAMSLWSPDLVPTLNPGHMNLYFSFPLPPGVRSIHFCFERMNLLQRRLAFLCII